MNSLKRRRLGAVHLTLAAALLAAGCEGPSKEVRAVAPERGEIRESFEEPGRTRLARVFPVTMPVDGRIGRIEMVAGAAVTLGQPLVAFDRAPLEHRVAEMRAAIGEIESELAVGDYDAIEETLAVEARATVDAAFDALRAARAQVEAEQMRANRSQKELRRIERLSAAEAVPEQTLDDARLGADTALIALREQQFTLAALETLVTAIQLGPRYVEQWLGRKRLERDVLQQRLLQARARLASAEHALALTDIRSPVDGIVLRRHQEGGGTLLAGSPLLEIGAMSDLEVVVDVLTEDAVLLAPDHPVSLTAPTLREPLAGRVQRIEPAGFTKRSSLGVEQQRVNVIVTLDAPPPRLGVGYRLDARFFTATNRDALTVPRFSVLESPRGERYVLLIEGARLKRRAVMLGLGNDLRVEIVEGLDANERIVAAPDTTMEDGEKVQAVEGW